MRVTYHPDAEAELIDAASYYAGKFPALGSEFLDETNRAVENILADPIRFEVIEDDI